ncbi:hypothetical protein H6G74_14485 [Nostoc spongiaeforme FACHB-130]|uniref:Uncharacterized protein n=1 Tax=Nostoc spongiaeforme FACHB-130 TaxID=1357510 RepID=A0ABR8FYY4_9NOSO|nr:hypothetical protein [Nostoc spongiaeforme]MBD2595527.1 hypothetical protein [Nostoc spongiaeforme FACHB-130]
MGLVAKVREIVNVKDYFTRMQQVIESNLQEDRKKRQAEEQARVDALKSKRQKREKIKFELITLYQETNPQKRGKELESILNIFFESENILVRESFTITGENNEGIIQ